MNDSWPLKRTPVLVASASAVDVQMKIKITRKLTGLLLRQLTKIITTTAQQNPKTAVAFGFKGFGGL